MAWRTICENATLEEAAKAVMAVFDETDKRREEMLANQKNQQLVQSSVVPDEKTSDLVIQDMVDEDSAVINKRQGGNQC